MYGPITARAAGCLLTGAAAVWLASCHSVGPTTIPRDRFDYSTAIGDSWKRQTLLNIVRLRYADPPIFVDVGQVVAGYSLETVVSAGGVMSSAGAVQGDSASLGAQGRFTDRPTITYTPLTGNRFIENIATPISPRAIFETIENGFPAHAMLQMGVASINGLRNVDSDLDGARPADPRFLEVASLLRDAQRTGGVGTRLRVDPEGRARGRSHAAQSARDRTGSGGGTAGPRAARARPGRDGVRARRRRVRDAPAADRGSRPLTAAGAAGPGAVRRRARTGRRRGPRHGRSPGPRRDPAGGISRAERGRRAGGCVLSPFATATGTSTSAIGI